MTRTQTIKVFLTDEEKAAVVAAAKSASIPPGAWARMVLLERARAAQTGRDAP